jgi:hypothetical protein
MCTVNEAYVNRERYMKGCKGEVSNAQDAGNESSVLSFNYEYFALFAYVKLNVYRSIMLLFLSINPYV